MYKILVIIVVSLSIAAVCLAQDVACPFVDIPPMPAPEHLISNGGTVPHILPANRDIVLRVYVENKDTEPATFNAICVIKKNYVVIYADTKLFAHLICILGWKG
ncbi:hypothetical protein KAU34_09740 [candidate division WOR-3 bacterium]|nr:hypothetical protein [candidate division WOR-3 bacterium]